MGEAATLQCMIRPQEILVQALCKNLLYLIHIEDRVNRISDKTPDG